MTIPLHLSGARARFVIAHELIESFFFSEDGDVPVHWSRLPNFRAMASAEALSARGYEERLADYGAGLVLIPSNEVDKLTCGGTRMPLYSQFRNVLRRCSSGRTNLTHRIASFLGVKNDRHAVVALVARGKYESMEDEWRLWPANGVSGYPAGIDIAATLRHRVFLPTNKSLKALGLMEIVEWLNQGGPDHTRPDGSEVVVRLHRKNMHLKLRHGTYDEENSIGILWFDTTIEQNR
jgi:hypothetical protein